MSNLLNERFVNVPDVVAQGVTQYSEGEAAEEWIANLKVDIPARPPAGLGFRVTLAGTCATGQNGAMTIKIYIGSTAVLSLAGSETTDGDWWAQGTIIFVDAKNQKCFGVLDKTGQGGDKLIDYAAGTVDCTAGAQLKASISLASGSDACTVEMWLVERWACELS